MHYMRVDNFDEFCESCGKCKWFLEKRVIKISVLVNGSETCTVFKMMRFRNTYSMRGKGPEGVGDNTWTKVQFHRPRLASKCSLTDHIYDSEMAPRNLYKPQLWRRSTCLVVCSYLLKQSRGIEIVSYQSSRSHSKLATETWYFEK